jgi:membrane protease YdiL (CAAX protease family)
MVGIGHNWQDKHCSRRIQPLKGVQVGPILNFILLTYAVTWTFFISAGAIAHETAPTDGLASVPALLVFFGTITPALVALVITARAAGTSTAWALFRRVFQWQAGPRWYVFAVSYMATIKLAVALAHRMMTGSWPPFDRQSFGIIIGSIIISTPFQSGEEIGWRGYALPLLAQRIGFARGSVLLGLVWACWHLPLFFLPIPGNDEYGQSFPVWALGVTALSVAFVWLYTNTNGNLLPTMLMHSAVNNIPHFLPSAVANARNAFSLHASLLSWLTTLFLWIPGAYFLIRMRRMEFVPN